jgi:hypothetical protein
MAHHHQARLCHAPDMELGADGGANTSDCRKSRRIVRHGRSMIFQMAEFMAPRELCAQILDVIATLHPNRRHDAEH